MGYLNKATITVDAILTNRGRELLAKGGVNGNNAFEITKFALSDDEVDYGLYNVAHPQGTEYYGAIIENMPVLEATPDEQQIMRYKLVSLNAADFGSAFVNKSTNQITLPTLNRINDIVLTSTTTVQSVDLLTTPSLPNNALETYTVLVSNAELIEIFQGDAASPLVLNTQDKINANKSGTYQVPTAPSTSRRISFRRKEGVTGSVLVTVFGNMTGASQTFKITVQ